MGYPTDSTSWPSPQFPSTAVKQLIDRFFSLVDLKDSDAGALLAKEIFSPDAKFVAATGSFEGSAEISESRRRVWDSVVARRHRVLKVYTNDADGLDLIIVGEVTVDPLEGEPETHEFVARATVVEDHTPRMRLYQVLVSGKEPGWYSL